MTTAKQVYEWVKTGHWNLAQFKEWAQPQQEPEYIQLRHKGEDGFSSWGLPLDPAHRNSKWAEGVEMRLLFTSPPTSTATSEDVRLARKPLTGDEITVMTAKAGFTTTLIASDGGAFSRLARAIEAAHGIKETP